MLRQAKLILVLQLINQPEGAEKAEKAEEHSTDFKLHAQWILVNSCNQYASTCSTYPRATAQQPK